MIFSKMKTLLYALGCLTAAYLWADKFLFGGALAGLFVEGWKQRLAPLCRLLPRRRGHMPPVPPPSAPVLNDDELVVRKSYCECPTVPAGAPEAEGASNASAGDTFVVPEDGSVEPEMQEWRAPEFGQPATPPVSHERKMPETTMQKPRPSPPLWEDDDFSITRIAATEDGEQEVNEVFDQERIRREVAQALEAIDRQRLEEELIPSDEERYGVEHFDADAYR